MAGDYSSQFQSALYAKLSGDATLMGMVSAIYDHVPETAIFPYISMGEIDARDSSTFGKDGQIMTATLHIWSRQRGRKEAQQIMARIHDLLHKGTLNVSGAEFAGSYYDFSAVILDGDGLTYHGIARYRAIVTEV